MKRVIGLAVTVVQLLSVSSAGAHSFEVRDKSDLRAAAFAGVRFRVSLGSAEAVEPRLELTVAPMVRGQSRTGRSQTSWGEGLSLAVIGEHKPQLTLIGQRLTLSPQRASRGYGPDRNGLSTLGTVALVGIGVAAIGGLALLAAIHADDEANCGNNC